MCEAIGVRWTIVLAVGAGCIGSAAEPKLVSFKSPDGGMICADLYGEGERGVVLAHGGRFNKESWGPQARTLESAGFRVLAIDFRGYGKSDGSGTGGPAQRATPVGRARGRAVPEG